MPLFVNPDGGSKDDEAESTRRNVLKGMGAIGSAGVLTSLAGCSGGPIGGPSGEREVREIELLSYTQSQKQIYNALNTISENMDEVLGFNMNFTPVNRDRQLQKVYTERDYDVSSLGYTGRPHRLDPHMLMYKNYHSSQSRPGSYNWTNFQDEKADELLDKQAETLDRDKRQKAVKEAQKYLMDLPGGEMPIVHGNLINVINTERFGNWTNVPGLGFKNIWTWTGVEPKTDRTKLVSSYTIAAGQLSPLVAGEANLITNRTTHDKLLRIGPDGLPKPWLATEYEVSNNGKTITFTLRDDLPNWHDGEPMTAEDIAFTFNYLREWETPFFASAVAPLKKGGASVLDDGRVEINLNRVFAPVFVLTFSRTHILPQHVWSRVPDETDVEAPYQWNPTSSDITNNGYVGSGPFKFDHWRKSEEIGLVANEEHFAAPNIDELIIRIVPESQAQTRGLERGEIDFLIQTGANPGVMEELANEQDALSFEAIRSVGYDELSMNTRRSPFDHAAVRKAVSSVIPKKTIAREMYNGYAEPAHSPTAPVLEFWHNKNVKDWTQVGDDQAVQYLEDAGFVLDGGSLYHPEGEVPENPAPSGPPERWSD
ncbi:MAG: ABC transporter substrate-binding protein [Halobacteriales archaeon]